MANELSWRHSATAKTIYATIRAIARTYWNGSALEALTVANWATYALALTESPVGSYFYAGSWPAALTTSGWYWVDLFDQIGGTPAIGDTPIATLAGYWNGQAFSPAATNAVQIGGTTQEGNDVALTAAYDAILADVVARLQRLGSGTATQQSPVQDGGAHLVLTQGEAYSGEDIEYESDDWDDLTGVRVWISGIYKADGSQAFEAECVVAVSGEGTQAVQVPITEAISLALQTGHRHIQFAVWAAYATKDRVLRRGDVSVLDDCIA